MKMQNNTKLILASQSPRRKELLEQLRIDIEITPSNIDESTVTTQEPSAHVKELAELKARQVSGLNPDAWVIGADTIVVTGGRILGKPGSQDEAEEMLNLLNGATHHVFTGFCITCSCRDIAVVKSVKTAVEFKPLSSDEIMWYIKTGEPFDKAGGYGIQGIGSFLVRGISGSYTNVVGLPVCEVFETLARLNIFQLRTKKHEHN